MSRKFIIIYGRKQTCMPYDLLSVNGYTPNGVIFDEEDVFNLVEQMEGRSENFTVYEIIPRQVVEVVKKEII